MWRLLGDGIPLIWYIVRVAVCVFANGFNCIFCRLRCIVSRYMIIVSECTCS